MINNYWGCGGVICDHCPGETCFATGRLEAREVAQETARETAEAVTAQIALEFFRWCCLARLRPCRSGARRLSQHYASPSKGENTDGLEVQRGKREGHEANF